MSFSLRDGIVVSDDLAAFEWLEHGFGTQSRNLMDTPDAAMLKQIHSSVCTVADAPGLLGEGDALITDRPGVAVGVKTADCVPILMVDPVRRVVGSAHAGWRGTVARIGPVTVRRICDEFGSTPADLVVAIGPSIGPCCFEVGPEVAVALGKSAKRTHLDLWAENRQQMAESGVVKVASSSFCARCGISPTFESFRRDGAGSGRMLSFIRIR